MKSRFDSPTLASSERNRRALAQLKARMSFGDLKEYKRTHDSIDDLVEAATGVRP